MHKCSSLLSVVCSVGSNGLVISSRLGVSECDVETSTASPPRPEWDCCATENNNEVFRNCAVLTKS